MARKKAGGALRPWLSAKPDGQEGRFTQIGNTLLLDKRFQQLSPGARWLYICLANESGGQREVKFSHGTARKYGVPPTTFDRYTKELKNAGFIALTGGLDYGRFSPNVFRFTLDWKTKPAPHFGER